MNSTYCEDNEVVATTREFEPSEKINKDNNKENGDEGQRFAADTTNNCCGSNSSISSESFHAKDLEEAPTLITDFQMPLKQNPNVQCGLATQEEQQQQQQLLGLKSASASVVYCDDLQADFFDSSQPLTERYSPLGANYDDAISPTSELISPESELEVLSSRESPDRSESLRNDGTEIGRLRNMEEEQELLTSSLLALTSHFAHVQLRVRQIVEAPSQERDQLLKDLEEFAFRGIPEPMNAAITTASCPSSSSLAPLADESTQQRQFELIDHLKSQLSELEKLAYESGAPVLPQHILLEKQKIIIDELKNKLNLKVEEHDLPELTREELKSQVENAFGEFVGPLKMKEQLVAQLKTQITDLERFIAFLQCDSDDGKLKTLTSSEKLNEAYNSYAAKKKGTATRRKPLLADEVDTVDSVNPSLNAGTIPPNGIRESLNSKAHGLMDKASILMQMFATTHFGTKPSDFQKNTLKKTMKGNHWGDLRAQLEVDIQEVASLAATLSFDREKLANIKRAMRKTKKSATSSANTANAANGTLTTVQPGGSRHRVASSRHTELKPYTVSSDSDEDVYDCYDWERNSRRITHNAHTRGGDSIVTISRELTTAVRKNFAMTLQRLIQHGLRVENESAASSLIVPFMRCLNPSPVFAAEQKYRTKDATPTNYDDVEEGMSADGGSFFGANGSRPMHAWELILEYYYLKHGDEYNNTPARKLSESFNLEIVDSHAVTAKQSLLSTVGMVIAMHRPYKRSYNAHFKAFVCAALNVHQLVEWLNLIFCCNDLIDTYYTPQSYVARTSFRDSLRSIDALTKYDFDLPVDLAIRHFKNI